MFVLKKLSLWQKLNFSNPAAVNLSYFKLGLFDLMSTTLNCKDIGI